MDNQVQTFKIIKLFNKFLQFIKPKSETILKNKFKLNFLQTWVLKEQKGNLFILQWSETRLGVSTSTTLRDLKSGKLWTYILKQLICHAIMDK